MGTTELRLLSQTAFPTAVSPEVLACCPTIDLSVTVADEDALYIRRPNGELVSRHAEPDKKVEAVRWKADGEWSVRPACLFK